MMIFSTDKGGLKRWLTDNGDGEWSSVEDSDKDGLRTLPFSQPNAVPLSMSALPPSMHAHLSTGRTYHYIDEHTENYGTTLLCVHGFPDLAYGWRLQVTPWVAQGYRVIAPDMLGYGKTDMPLDPSAYTTKRLCDDLAALLDHLGVRKVVSTGFSSFSSIVLSSAQVVIGHDWGSLIAGRFALWYPDRLLALALYACHSLNTATAKPADIGCPHHIPHR